MKLINLLKKDPNLYIDAGSEKTLYLKIEDLDVSIAEDHQRDVIRIQIQIPLEAIAKAPNYKDVEIEESNFWHI